MAGYCTYCIITKKSLLFLNCENTVFLTVGLLRQDSAKHPNIVFVLLHANFFNVQNVAGLTKTDKFNINLQCSSAKKLARTRETRSFC